MGDFFKNANRDNKCGFSVTQLWRVSWFECSNVGLTYLKWVTWALYGLNGLYIVCQRLKVIMSTK